MEVAQETIFDTAAGKKYQTYIENPDNYYLYRDLKSIWDKVVNIKDLELLDIQHGDKISSYELIFLRCSDGLYLLRNSDNNTTLSNTHNKLTILNVSNSVYNQGRSGVKSLEVQPPQNAIGLNFETSLFLAKFSFKDNGSLALYVFDSYKFDDTFESEQLIQSNALVNLNQFEEKKMKIGMENQKVLVQFGNHINEIQQAILDPSYSKTTNSFAKYTDSKKRKINKFNRQQLTESIDIILNKIEKNMIEFDAEYLPEFERDSNGIIEEIVVETPQSFVFLTSLLSNTIIEKWLDGAVLSPTKEFGIRVNDKEDKEDNESENE